MHVNPAKRNRYQWCSLDTRNCFYRHKGPKEPIGSAPTSTGMFRVTSRACHPDHRPFPPVTGLSHRLFGATVGAVDVCISWFGGTRAPRDELEDTVEELLGGEGEVTGSGSGRVG
ncbi:hypothetical protein GCM10009850_046750 [Nonomuraea monospora]|uniref:Uncharacterized protein n=1 Tax=Nonomuraea monospora TaxID=568818 RepID=A0ABP5PEX8_9ACTN